MIEPLTSGVTVPKTADILIVKGLSLEQAKVTLLHEMCHAALIERGECEDEEGLIAYHGDNWKAELRRVIDLGADFMRDELQAYTRPKTNTGS